MSHIIFTSKRKDLTSLDRLYHYNGVGDRSAECELIGGMDGRRRGKDNPTRASKARLKGYGAHIKIFRR